ncbi:hypothetical protein Tco_0630696 [Tanacetum coccineum]
MLQISHKAFDRFGVHVLLMETGFVIHMMVENKYPLSQDTLSKALSRRLEFDHQSEMGYELIMFVKSQTSAKVKTVNEEQQIHGLVDKKKVIISETSIRSDLQLDDDEGTYCLPTATIFAELERIGAKTTSWNEFSSTMTSAIISTEDMGADSATPTDSHSTPIITQPSSSKPQKKKSRRKQRKDNAPTEPTTEETTPKEHVSTPSYDPPPSGEDRMQLAELMKESQAVGKRRKSRISGLRRLRKVGSSSRVESSNDASLGAQEDASKQGKKIEDLDADAEVTLVNETQEMNDDNLMFDTGVLEEQEIKFEKVVEEPVVSVATTTKSIPVSTAEEEQVPASTKTFSSSQSQLPQVKDKGKGKMVEPEVPLKKKDQVALDEEMARNLEAQLQAELIEEERLARQKEEEANIALIESWDKTQAMMEGRLN